LQLFLQQYVENCCKNRHCLLKNLKDRAAICKIRISAHNLMIEKGRHLNIIKKDRNCPISNMGLIENEEHFLLHCKEYKCF
jgi:hypothetical protein